VKDDKTAKEEDNNMVSPRAYGHKDPRVHHHHRYRNPQEEQQQEYQSKEEEENEAAALLEDDASLAEETPSQTSWVRRLLLLSLGLAVTAASLKLLQRRLRRSRSFLPTNYHDYNGDNMASLLGVFSWGKQSRYTV